MKVYETALYPFSVLYDGITRLRNHLYELEIKKSCSFEPVVINVGNLSVGGTGKTPMIEYLIRMLHERYRLATLSRGYGRKSRGFRIAGEEDSAESIGDEPYQFYQAWKGKVVVAVGEERVLAISQILFEHPEVEVILLDDAYQHRPVVPDLNILLTTWQRPFFRDYVLPAGRLRESRKGAGRAHAVVVTKCPGKASADELARYREQVRMYAGPDTPVFFSTLSYSEPKAFNEWAVPPFSEVVLVSGLANARLLEEEVQRKFNLLRHFQYPDHHRYSRNDLDQIAALAKAHPGSVVLTTEKDAVKWLAPSFQEALQEVPVFSLPVYHYFLEGEEAFENQVLKTIREKKKV